MQLSILCVTQAESSTLNCLNRMSNLAIQLGAELVFAADGAKARYTLQEFGARVVEVEVLGPSLECVLDEAVAACSGEYILRLDDDEQCSLPMTAWLERQEYVTSDHWSFPRVHFWKDQSTVLLTDNLWPDLQTRLSVKSKSGGRHQLHCGSPFGTGTIAEVPLEHLKFLVKNYENRLTIAHRYDDYFPGFGTGMMLPYSLPEDAYHGQLVPMVGYKDGQFTAYHRMEKL